MIGRRRADRAAVDKISSDMVPEEPRPFPITVLSSFIPDPLWKSGGNGYKIPNHIGCRRRGSR